MTDWIPTISATDRPLYRSIVDALRLDIRDGRLNPGDRLPPQRSLADRLGIDFTTVSRAYSQARSEGLIEAHVGRGTFVAARKGPQQNTAPARPPLDLSMNQPPPIPDPDLIARLRSAMGRALSTADADLLTAYKPVGGSMADREIGRGWLKDLGLTAADDRILVAPGAQAALMATLSSITQAGDVVFADQLTYPGFKAAATQLGLTTIGITSDQSGVVPESLAEALCGNPGKIVYLCPTLNNPTTATLPEDRRQALADIAQLNNLTIIEDDAYGALVPAAPPPIASFAPSNTVYISGLAKCLSPSLRIAYIAAPTPTLRSRLGGALRACCGMTCPISTAIVKNWIETGLAAEALAAIRAETEARQILARRILPPALLTSSPGAFHAWLQLPETWNRGAFLMQLQTRHIGAVASDSFAIGPAPEAVRLGLGAPATLEDLQTGLQALADLLAQPPELASGVV